MDTLIDGADYRITLHYQQPGKTTENTARNEANLLAALNGLKSGDEDRFWALYDPDVVFHEADCLPYGGAHRGIEATKRAHASIYQYFDQIHAEIEQIMSAGDLSMAYVRLTYRVRKNGRTGSFPLTEIYRFRNGKIIEWRAIYFNADIVSDALAAA